MNNKFLQIFKNVFLNKNQNSNIKRNIIVAKDEDHLDKLINKEIKKYGNSCDLNHIDVSKVTDMDSLFYGSEFNGDISQWNVSNVENMSAMFYESEFNGDISRWNVSNVKDMSYMFSFSEFNDDISWWDVINVKDTHCMFQHSQFNGNIDDWKPYKADIPNMFTYTNIQLPYWYSYDNLEERKIAIDSYIEKKMLNEKLNVGLDSKLIINCNNKIALLRKKL
jgi:hypothetical protein